LAATVAIPWLWDESRAEIWAARSEAEESPGAVPEGSPRRTLEEFELLSVLGRGGMSVVYRAWQPSLGRQVALRRLLGVHHVTA
jgi:serine/threonine protein kinase